MKVLLISARADHGGGPQNLFQHVEVLAGRLQIFVACPREEPYWNRCEKIVGPAQMFELPHRAFNLKSVWALATFIRREKIELVHSHGFGAGLYGRLVAILTGAPCVHTPHGVTPATDLGGWMKLVVDWVLSLFTARLIAVSPGDAKCILPRCIGAWRVVTILNGVKIAAAPVPATLFDERPLRVVHVTRFIFHKNPELFIAIVDELEKAGVLAKFRFVLLGNGPGRADFEAQISARGWSQQFEMLGAIGNVSEQYARSFCLVSTSRWEGMPLALLEAMGCGVPVVASDVVGNRDAVAKGTTGFLFDLEQPAEAARRLIELSESRELWLAQSRASYQRVQDEFSEERMAGQSLEVYREALGQPPETERVSS